MAARLTSDRLLVCQHSQGVASRAGLAGEAGFTAARQTTRGGVNAGALSVDGARRAEIGGRAAGCIGGLLGGWLR
ncbi:hypothetical protein CATMQ487_07250 [Sphaerotilus microaerophilus]|uniref:Uncharacterized protein n=1 Tax=Sphaerotilus microaerophilus TaxID=2914710 RepID=A0ABM7YHT3_9BURK|nr:hypothetical protein CATMQ487_07250 [Sphaerotilus sp. FB-5]